ncbi:MAG TPA: DUF4215 domain-containing protein, partial [Kofleriaceae bacterium]|nr:DUF4215 domain-containing protein [Kofleriaceae bacterium]
DGNTTNGDGCDNNCTATACGNGIPTGTEACDDGNTMNGDGCDNNCTATACGNGIPTGTEACDDGNGTNGDGCDNNCTATACGNGIPTGTEACDDGNGTNGDGCDNNCTATACGNGIPTTGEACDDGNATNGDGCDNNCTATACGNGIPTTGEGCDDGNTTNGDGCDNNCTPTACGNGIPSTGEGCDDGNTTDGDGCDSNCTVTGCGNGIPTTGEACDDGNATNGDGCDVNCTVTACGNGIPSTGEACDDGNTTNGDGCDSNCTVTGCGNGIPTPGEACDDGNPTNGDGCDSNCTFSACGNGVIAANEECDDGNSTPLDGCSVDCTLEPLEQEPNEDGTPSLGGTATNGNDFGTTFSDAIGAFTRTTMIRAAIAPAGDEDVYLLRNTSTTPQVVTLNIWNPQLGVGQPCGTTFDSVLHIRTAAGASLALNDDRNGVLNTDLCSAVMYQLAPGASVYAHVSVYDDNLAIPAYVLDVAFRGIVCGDAVIGPTEQCDDGNTTSGDGCNATCQIETRAEVEPNNTNAQAMTNAVQITGDITLQAAITPLADVDTFQLTVATTTVVRFEALTSLYECPTATIDLRLFNSAGTSIVTDLTGKGIGGCGAIVIPLDPGTYFIRAEERGNNATIASYLLQVDYQTNLGAEPEGSNVTGVNDTPATADRNLLGGDNVYVFGNHLDTEDVDVYAITVPGLARIRAEVVEGNRAMETCESLGVDSRLTLFDQNGVQMVDDDDGGRPYCSMIDGSGAVPLDPGAKNVTTSPQTYYLMVRRSDLAVGGEQTFSYRLQVSFH